MRVFLTFVAIAFTTFAGEAGGLDRAQNFYNHTDYSAAIAILMQAPESPKSLALLGQSYFMDGEYRKAVDTLERAASLAPNSSDIQTWLGRAYGRRAETSFALQAIGFASKSRQAFEKAVKLDPHNREALNDLFEFYVEAPGFMGGGIDKAKSLLPAIAQDDPAEIYFARARIAEKKDQLGDAEAQLRRAVDIAPHQVGRLLDLAKFLYKEGRFDEGDSFFRAAEQSAPNAPRILFARASAYIQSKRNIPEAASLLKRYIASDKLTPDDPPRTEAMKLLKQAQGS
jgi:cytochrome c-type biogenesis protein CcmH/NrfG